jgi:DNA-binding transcriptional MerR regulator
MKIEETAAKLVILAGKPTLSKAEHQEVVKLMRLLKQAGMSNEEISTLSKGKWSISTVKGYTKGVKAPHSNLWQDAVSLLNDVISSGITLDDVQTALTIHDDVHSYGIDLDQMLDFISAADSASINVVDVIQQHVAMKKLGLSPKDAAEVLLIKKELEKQGLNTESLKPLLGLVKTYGEPSKIMEAVTKYGSLTALEEKAVVADSQVQDLNMKMAGIHKEIEKAEVELSQKKEPLEAY